MDILDGVARKGGEVVGSKSPALPGISLKQRSDMSFNHNSRISVLLAFLLITPLASLFAQRQMETAPQTRSNKILVSSVPEFVMALASMQGGDTLFVGGDAVLDLTDLHPIRIPGGVFISSDRGQNESPGGLLFTHALDAMPLLLVIGDSTRISGLRIFGPDSSRRTLQMKTLHALGRYYSIPVSRGIQTQADHLEVDNCEIAGWSHAGIFLDSGAEDANVHHNYIHHNQRSGLGYGVALKSSHALIHNNHFDWNRHAIAGTGEPGTSYHAHDNTIGPNGSGHAFDMHGHWQNKDSNPVGGDSILIENNLFLLSGFPAVMIRGTPRLGAEIRYNTFNTTEISRAVVLKNGADNVTTHNNKLLP